MLEEFTERRAWASFVVGLFFGPVVGMMYLGKGRKALVYAVATILLAIPFGFSLSMNVKLLFLHLIGAAHCYVVAGRMPDERPRVWFARWYWVLVVIIIAPTIIFLPMRAFLWEPFTASSGSMLPTLDRGSLVFATKYAYGYSNASYWFGTSLGEGRIFYSPPERGDIAVFKTPMPAATDYLKRIIGLPGDTIQIKKGVLFINGKTVERKFVGEYVDHIPRRDQAMVLKRYIETLPNGRQYHILEETDTMLTDNTPVYKVPPAHFFVLGDNRDLSRDSRFLNDIGYIPVENLVGRVSP